jgi:hypothetical protein
LNSGVVTVFGSSRPLEGEPEYVMAHSLGAALAGEGFAVCNGGYGGTMEGSARGARERNGRTIGVTVKSFRRTPNPWIQTVIVRETLLERMLTLVEMGSAYVVLPGGTGTLLELAAVWEFMNKDLLPVRPVVTLGTFWDPVVGTVAEQLRRERHPAGAGLIHVEPTPESCVSYITTIVKGARA